MDEIELTIERPDGTTFTQCIYLCDIPMEYYEFDENGYLYLNFRAMSLHFFGSGYQICHGRLKD